jgi:hypothetical protein
LPVLNGFFTQAARSAPAPVDSIVTGAGAGGGPHVQVTKNGAATAGWYPYENSFHGGVRVAAGALGDVDGLDEVVTAPGPGRAPEVRVYHANGAFVAGFVAYPGFQGGVFVAAGDLNGDGFDEIITGAGAGGAPHVRVFNANGTPTGIEFLAYASSFSGGVTVAAGDVDNDGRDEIITGAGPGGGPHVKVWKLDVSQQPFVLSEVGGFMAYDRSFSGGVNVAASDGVVITGAGAGGGPHVKVFDQHGGDISGFMAYGTFNGGVWPSGAFIGAGRVVTGPGAGGGPHVRTFDDAGADVGPSFYAYAQNFSGGVFVARADETADDADGDGISDEQEARIGTDPNNADTDNDGIEDIIETNGGQPGINTDGDQLIDAKDTDTDGDTKSDSAEGTGDCDSDGIGNWRDNNDPCSPTTTTTLPGGSSTTVASTTTTIAATTTTTACMIPLPGCPLG